MGRTSSVILASDPRMGSVDNIIVPIEQSSGSILGLKWTSRKIEDLETCITDRIANHGPDPSLQSLATDFITYPPPLSQCLTNYQRR